MTTAIFKAENLAQKLIVWEPSTLRTKSLGGITGVIYWETEHGAFPDGSWDDFVAVIASWWVKALALLEQGKVSEAEFRFMDGPFSISVRRKENTCRMIFQREKSAIWEQECSFLLLQAELERVGREILQECKTRGVSSRDIKDLEREFRKRRNTS